MLRSEDLTVFVYNYETLFYILDKVNVLTKEERNFIRYYLLCQTLGIETVRTFFVGYVPESTLARHMSCLESKSWNSSSEQLALLDAGI